MTSVKARKFTAFGAVLIAGAIACGGGLLTACSNRSKETEEDDGAVTVTGVATNNFDHFYTSDDVIDFSQLTLTVTYSDHTSRELTSMDPDGYGTADGSEAEFVLYTDGLYDRSVSHGTAELGRYGLTCTLAENGEDYDLGDVLVLTESDFASLSLVYYGDPSFVDEYKDNLERCGVETEETDEADDNDFAGETSDYLVGDDNGFVFRPELTLADPDNFRNSHTQSNYSADVSVTKEGDSQPLNLDDNLYVSYSDFTFDFTDAAVDSRFTIEMTPTDFKRDFAGESVQSVGMTVLICDGYNAYEAVDLAHMALVDDGTNLSEFGLMAESKRVFWDENTNTFEKVKTYELWKEFLRDKGEPEDSLVSCNGIFVHGDISVTDADMPEEFFVSKSEARYHGVDYDYMVGSIRDNILPYSHYMTDDFIFGGNLFKIDCSAMKYCLTHSSSSAVTDEDGNKSYGLKYDAENSISASTSNVRLFAFLGIGSDEPEKVNPSTRYVATFRDVDIVGNMSNDGYEESGKETGMAAGSLQMALSNSSKLVMTNCIVKDFVIAVNCENSKSGYTCLDMADTKILDCYNCGVYLSNSAENSVSNCVFKRIGGPAVMASCRLAEDALDDGDNYYGVSSGVIIDENTVMENYLAGDEAWFVSMDMTWITSILVWVDGLFNTLGKTIYTGESVTEGNDGSVVTSPAVNLHYMGVTSSSFSDTRLNLDLTIGGYDFLLNEEGFAKDGNGKDVTSYDPQYYASEADFVSAMLNWSMDYNKQLPLAFVTNTGEMFTSTFQSISSETPFYTMESYYTCYGARTSGSSLVPQTLGFDDTEVFIYSWIAGYGAVLALSVADLEENV